MSHFSQVPVPFPTREANGASGEKGATDLSPCFLRGRRRIIRRGGMGRLQKLSRFISLHESRRIYAAAGLARGHYDAVFPEASIFKNKVIGLSPIGKQNKFRPYKIQEKAAAGLSSTELLLEAFLHRTRFRLHIPMNLAAEGKILP